jgi:hypothetical protein
MKVWIFYEEKGCEWNCSQPYQASFPGLSRWTDTTSPTQVATIDHVVGTDVCTELLSSTA